MTVLKNWLRRRLSERFATGPAASVEAPCAAPCDAPCAAPCDAPCDAPCADPCPIAVLPVGVQALIVSVGCPLADASRLRVLGVFEGARVGIVQRRGGLLLNVRGSRLALDAAAAMTILAVQLPA